MAGRRPPKSRPAAPPASAEEGAARVTAAVVPIFDRGDGTGADWRLMAESVFRCAFVMLDGLPDDQKHALAHRVYTGAYERFLSASKDESGSSKTGSADAENAPTNTSVLKSSRPRPPH